MSPADAAMWAALEARLRAEDPRRPYVDALLLVDGLLAGRPGAHDAFNDAVASWHGPSLQALYVVTVERTGGLNGPARTPSPEPLPCPEALVQGRLLLNTRVVQDGTGHQSDQLTPDDLPAMQACTPFDATVEALAPLIANGQVPDHAIRNLSEAIEGYVAVRGAAHPSPAGVRLLHWKEANALDWLARSYALLADHDDARRCFAQAATANEEAGDHRGAQACRIKIAELEQARCPDADARLIGLLAQIDAVAPDSLEGIEARVGMAQICAGKADFFGAGTWVQEALAALEHSGYSMGDDIDAALIGWIARTPEGEPGSNHSYRTLMRVITLHSALAAVRQVTEPAHAGRHEAVIERLADIVMALPAHIEHVAQGLDAACGGFAVPGCHPVAEAERLAQARAAAANAALLSVFRRIGRLEDRLAGLHSAEDPSAALAEAAAVVAAAREIGQPLPLANALRTQAQALQAAGQMREGIVPLQEAHALTSALEGDNARDVAMGALSSLVYLHTVTGNVRGASDLAGEAIARIEAERSRINAPYLQAAYLSNYLQLFVGAIFTAFKLDDHELMLARMELSKAHASVRNLAAPGARPETAITDLDRELRDLTSQLATASPELEPGLREKRRRLWDRRTAIKATRSAVPFSLEAVQAALGQDGAVISYYWLSDTVLIVTTITVSDMVVERIVLTPEQRALLERFIGELRDMKGANLSLDATFIDPLGTVLLPERGRALIEGRRRLAISPHRLLHWFPFHAVCWGGARMGTAFAVRYIPNLTSLLMPARAEPAGAIAGIAVSTTLATQEHLGTLTGSAQEITDLAEIYRRHGFRVEVLPNATRAQLLRWVDAGILGDAPCIYLKTHGKSVAADVPMESIVYTADGAIDGLEIASWRLGCEAVVLTSCDSGQRAVSGRGMQELPGDELLGLPAAFLSAGARNVVAAIWPVDNAASLSMMEVWHRCMAGGDPADVAMQEAMREYLATASPVRSRACYWAPFFVVSIGMPHSLGRPPNRQEDHA